MSEKSLFGRKVEKLIWDKPCCALNNPTDMSYELPLSQLQDYNLITPINFKKVIPHKRLNLPGDKTGGDMPFRAKNQIKVKKNDYAIQEKCTVQDKNIEGKENCSEHELYICKRPQDGSLENIDRQGVQYEAIICQCHTFSCPVCNEEIKHPCSCCTTSTENNAEAQKAKMARERCKMSLKSLQEERNKERRQGFTLSRKSCCKSNWSKDDRKKLMRKYTFTSKYASCPSVEFDLNGVISEYRDSFRKPSAHVDYLKEWKKIHIGARWNHSTRVTKEPDFVPGLAYFEDRIRELEHLMREAGEDKCFSNRHPNELYTENLRKRNHVKKTMELKYGSCLPHYPLTEK